MPVEEKPKNAVTCSRNFSGASHMGARRPSVKICWVPSVGQASVWVWAESARGSACWGVELSRATVGAHLSCLGFAYFFSFSQPFAAPLNLDVAAVFVERSGGIEEVKVKEKSFFKKNLQNPAV